MRERGSEGVECGGREGGIWSEGAREERGKGAAEIEREEGGEAGEGDRVKEQSEEEE